MKVFLLKDVDKVGMAGEMITVADGFAINFLLPRKCAVEVTSNNEKSFLGRKLSVENRQEVLESRSSMLAERIKATTIVLKRKLHDDEKLYGSISASDIVTALAEQGISVEKNQIILAKGIKKAGVHRVNIKLSARLQPVLVVKVVASAD